MDNQKTTPRPFNFDEECISSSIRTPDFKDYEKYEINPTSPGVVLIIDEKNFYTEFDDKYKVSQEICQLFRGVLTFILISAFASYRHYVQIRH